MKLINVITQVRAIHHRINKIAIYYIQNIQIYSFVEYHISIIKILTARSLN